MSDAAMTIASSALQTQQTVMDTIAQDLANVDTAAYRAEQAQLSPAGGGVAGSGVSVISISQAGSALLTSAARTAQAGAAQQQAASGVLASAVAAFPEPSSSGLGAQLAGFWSSWDGVANSPTQPAARMQVLEQAQNVVAGLRAAAATLASTASGAANQLTDSVRTANDALVQIAHLNGSIVAAQAGGQSAAALIDQRAALLDTVSSQLGTHTLANSSGSVDVLVGGIRLVQGVSAATVAVQTGSTSPLGYSLQVGQSTLAVSSGTASGLLSALNQNIPGYQHALDGVAAALTSTVNTALSNGQDAAGNPGVPLFTATAGAEASTIAVSAAVANDPTLLAAAAKGGGPADGSNAQYLATLGESAAAPDALYRGLVGQVGGDAQGAQQQLAAQQTLAGTAQQARQSVGGVHSDQELISMVSAQSAYQAAAKVVSTIETMVSSLLAAT